MKRLIMLGFVGAITVTAGACSGPGGIAGAGPGTPGWTGRTVVIGDDSTIAGDSQATYLQQKWPYGDLR
jgi:hypothetical protein